MRIRINRTSRVGGAIVRKCAPIYRQVSVEPNVHGSSATVCIGRGIVQKYATVELETKAVRAIDRPAGGVCPSTARRLVAREPAIADLDALREDDRHGAAHTGGVANKLA